MSGNLRFSPADYERLAQADSGAAAYFDSGLNSDMTFRRPFVGFLDCETRLNLPNEAAIAPLDRPPQDPLNVLFRNKRLLRDNSVAIKSQFSWEL